MDGARGEEKAKTDAALARGDLARSNAFYSLQRHPRGTAGQRSSTDGRSAEESLAPSKQWRESRRLPKNVRALYLICEKVRPLSLFIFLPIFGPNTDLSLSRATRKILSKDEQLR